MKIHWPKIHSFRRHLEIKVLWESDDDEMMPRGFFNQPSSREMISVEHLTSVRASLVCLTAACTV